MAYHLSPHLHHAVADGRNIFLDLTRDRYFALGDRQDQTFTRWWSGEILSEQDHHTLSRLAQAGIFRIGTDMSARRIDALPGRTSALDAADDDRATISALGTAVLAILAAKRRHQGALRASLAAVDRHALPSRPGFELATVIRHARAFQRAALLTRTRDQCVPCSVALTIHLRRRAIPALLIVGVSGRPFAAHCWVQVDDIIVNDMTDHVAAFVPILVR